jgi:K+-transporting ATPase KdpF subunit
MRLRSGLDLPHKRVYAIFTAIDGARHRAFTARRARLLREIPAFSPEPLMSLLPLALVVLALLIYLFAAILRPERF